MNAYAKQIAKLRKTAESGEQWAEICRLEALALADAFANPETLCKCGNPKFRAGPVCRECL
jgi:hypothetical protein